MTDIEKQALALVNTVRAERGIDPLRNGWIDRDNTSHEAICRALEMLEAHKREVSDACYGLIMENTAHVPLSTIERALSRFIIPDPVDPLVEALSEIDHAASRPAECAAELRTAMKARGYAFTKIEDTQP